MSTSMIGRPPPPGSTKLHMQCQTAALSPFPAPPSRTLRLSRPPPSATAVRSQNAGTTFSTTSSYCCSSSRACT
eukprot:353183-Chlamydomonas_euryale.AAC.16